MRLHTTDAEATAEANAAGSTAESQGASAADHAAALGKIACEQAQLMQRMQEQMLALEKALRAQPQQSAAGGISSGAKRIV